MVMRFTMMMSDLPRVRVGAILKIGMEELFVESKLYCGKD